MEKDANNPLEALENLGQLYAFTYKIAGEDGILELFGDRLIGAEYIRDWATKLRAMKLLDLADLLDNIGAGQ